MDPQLDHRIVMCNGRSEQTDGEYVLYWMAFNRRPENNFSLQIAVDKAIALNKPLLILETLWLDYPNASARFHKFVLDGMKDNERAFRKSSVTYIGYVERDVALRERLLQKLASNACLVVTDAFPCEHMETLIKELNRLTSVSILAVDSNGILPVMVPEKAFTTAYSFRRYLQKNLHEHLLCFPRITPCSGQVLPKAPDVSSLGLTAWGCVDGNSSIISANLKSLPINHAVPPATLSGGRRAGLEILKEFVSFKLRNYASQRNSIDECSASGLSPYLHFGHISSHDIFTAVMQKVGWTPACLHHDNVSGKRLGWWGLDEDVESFLDQLITWREIGFNAAYKLNNFDKYESLPVWAKTTLADHELDLRTHLYQIHELENAETHDEIWNAAQRQLVKEGRMHNYLRMLWGKKVLEWSRSSQEALERLIYLNNKYALDGNNPNSYSGIFWCFGRYDRAWGPERPIFGKVRYMTSKNTARKLRLAEYLSRYQRREPLEV
ncbi:MAG: deoxyribodipyrimidine photolyase [Rhodospirillaceae bacterium]|nr:deoxyribodipyrimidine photolyase [Rhodospirillaceae bacterium]|tara:strand:- start:3303 stop:4787 length:1485 start_codon:yes stop_codon:yes gene_type:complete